MTPNQKCPLCRERKPKRSCPALGQTICTVCCATKRQVEINCPPDCVYLSSAKAHPPAVVQRRQERDVAFILPLVSELTDTQYRLLLMFQSLAVQHARATIPPLLDQDIADGAAAAAATLETARKGIIYEHLAVSVPAQRFASELGRAVAELIGRNSSHQARIERDSAAALRKLEEGARTAGKALAGDESPVYLGLLERMLQPGAGGAGTDDAGDPSSPLDRPTSSGLIIPP
jgi:hypothetical protein